MFCRQLDKQYAIKQLLENKWEWKTKILRLFYSPRKATVFVLFIYSQFFYWSTYYWQYASQCLQNYIVDRDIKSVIARRVKSLTLKKWKEIKIKKIKIYNKIEWKTDIRVYVGCEKNQARKHLLTNALVNITVTVKFQK